MHGVMEQVSPSNTGGTAGRRLCLPYELSALFPVDEACTEIVRTGCGPYTMESIGREAPIRFPFYGEEVVSEGGVFTSSAIRRPGALRRDLRMK